VLQSNFNPEKLLRGAFTEAELAFLRKQQPFAAELARLTSPDDFEQVCVVGEQLLTDNDIGHSFSESQATQDRDLDPQWLRRAGRD
jgi:hypothetical protein